MIGSFILFAALFAAASLCWGFLFSIDTDHFGRRQLSATIIISVVVSIFSAVFFLKGISEIPSIVPESYGDFGMTISSGVFALTFALTLVIGSGLSIYHGTAKIFSSIEEMIKGAPDEKDRTEIIDQILDRTTESGQINVLERELIESVLKFKDKVVREVMVPRGDVVALDVEEDPKRSLRKVIEEGYSRLPVYRGSIDNIVGIIYAKDLLTMMENGGVIVLQDLLRPPYYVPETKKISRLLREMQKDKVHQAIVVDEFGGTEGIITLEDVLEEIVGEIQDEYDENFPELVHEENGDTHISGSMTVSRFNELLEAQIPQGDDYDTMAGFVQKLAGKLPQKDEIYNHGEMFFCIEEVARHRIKRLKISYKEHPASPVSEINQETNPQASAIGNKEIKSRKSKAKTTPQKLKPKDTAELKDASEGMNSVPQDFTTKKGINGKKVIRESIRTKKPSSRKN